MCHRFEVKLVKTDVLLREYQAAVVFVTAVVDLAGGQGEAQDVV